MWSCHSVEMEISAVRVLISIFSITVIMSSQANTNIGNEDPAVTKLREFLKIPTVHPKPEPGYEQAIQWLRAEAEDIGLEFNLIGLGESGVPHEFALWLTWKGTDPSLKSILFNTHMDVVPVDPSKWKHPPFDAHKDDQGNIYARGASDMKSTVIAELEALRRLNKSGFVRYVLPTCPSCQEYPGTRGMMKFVKTNEFKNLNVGVDIDEGFCIHNPNVIQIMYAEKSNWEFTITALGEAGHGSTLPQFTAGHRLKIVIDRLMEFRESQFKQMKDSNVSIEQITTVNLVRLGGGIADNIIPSELWATFDMRLWLKPGWSFKDAESMLRSIMEEARLGGGPDSVSIEFIDKNMFAERTSIDNSNAWWSELQVACRETNVTCEPHVMNGATDGRFVRPLGIPVLGICIFPNTPSTAHQDNEHIKEAEFLRGIDRYTAIIRRLSMLSQ